MADIFIGDGGMGIKELADFLSKPIDQIEADYRKIILALSATQQAPSQAQLIALQLNSANLAIIYTTLSQIVQSFVQVCQKIAGNI